MRVARLIFVLVLTVALFPWGAYAKVQGLGVAGVSAQVADQGGADVRPVATAQRLCHGAALPCAPVLAVLPPAADLPPPVRADAMTMAEALWAQGRSVPPPLGPPIR